VSPLEQESLLLRQVVALRRRGLAHHAALALAAEGLPPGALSDRVRQARRTLEVGGSPAGRGVLALLSRGGPVEAIERAAQANDARLAAAAALSTTRLYLAVGLAGPLLLGCALAWLLPADVLLGDAVRPVSGQPGGVLELAISLASWLVWGLRITGLPLAVGVLVGLRRLAARLAPGAERLQVASALLDAAALGEEPPGQPIGEGEERYYGIRRRQVGPGQAAAELAAELASTADRELRIFRHVAPVVGAAVGFLVLLMVLALFFTCMFALGM